jgi:hypothetical protein
MNITKKLHDELIECGFLFPKKNINQAEGLLAKVEFYFLDQWQTIHIRNNDKTTLKDVMGILADKVFELGVEKGIKKGKKEVGTYLKDLIEE